jgi:hypothetical protein
MQRLSAYLLVFLMVSPLLAVEVVDGPHVEVSAKGAVVRWRTDVESGSRVKFGVSKDQLQTQSGVGVTTNHEVTLVGLKPASVYYFNVGTAKRVLKEGEFTTAAMGASASPDLGKQSPRGPPPPTATPAPAMASALKAESSVQKPQPKVPPLQSIWGSLDSLEDHYERHGADFGSRSAEDYAQEAWLFLQRAIEEGLPAKLDETDGTVRVFDPKMRAFAAYRRDGRARTYFKPQSRDYFERQPGKPVRLTRRSSR